MMYKYVFKYIIVGDANCGKSSLMNRYTNNTFDQAIPCTVGVDFSSFNKKIEKDRIKVQIWDLAGLERYRAIVKSYYRDTTVVILVYDITNGTSFNHMEFWLNQLKNKCKKYIDDEEVSPIYYLVGNKKDLPEYDRKVNYQDGYEFAEENDFMGFLETSAKTGENVEKLFDMITDEVYFRIINGEKVICKISNQSREKLVVEDLTIEKKKFCCKFG